MRVILTGVSGNLGSEIFKELISQKIDVIPLTHRVSVSPNQQKGIVADLISSEKINFHEKVDGIIHSAGIVHFLKSVDSNQKMMTNVCNFAEQLHCPIYYVSTAFAKDPRVNKVLYNNAYELDKFKSEKILKKSGVRFTIFRPSVLTGSTQDGSITNFTGYYMVVKKFIHAILRAKGNGHQIRFPKLIGHSDIVPVDVVAEKIVSFLKQKKMNELYLTNSNPPKAMELLNQTLDFYGLKKDINFLDMPFEEYASLNLTSEEIDLLKMSYHFSPYWSSITPYPTILSKSYISKQYIIKILTFFKENEK